jgi:hypothetical protein
MINQYKDLNSRYFAFHDYEHKSRDNAARRSSTYIAESRDSFTKQRGIACGMNSQRIAGKTCKFI